MKLTAYAFIKTLSEETLVSLYSKLQPIKMQKNNLLFYQGDICDRILWLTKGEVRLYAQAEGVEEITLYTIKPGEQCIINTASLLSQTKAIATAEAITSIEGYLLDIESVKRLAKESDAYQNYLFSLYQLRFTSLTDLISDIKFKKLDSRILEWIEGQNSNTIDITHEALSAELGTSRVVVSRILKELEHNGHIVLHRGKIERVKNKSIQ